MESLRVQSSGPTLWNILYNDLLLMDQPIGVKLIGFADDVAMVVTAKSEETLMNIANTGLRRISNWMNERLLHLAPQKTEAVILTKKRKMHQLRFTVMETVVIPSPSIRYLGVHLDTKLTFSEHLKNTINKAEKTMKALSAVMPNIGGPRSSKRKLLASVVQSQILYAAPIWHTAMEKPKLKQRLLSLQRLCLIRVCSAYRSISTEAVGVIAGIPPIHLLVKENTAKYGGISKVEARRHLMETWQREWENTTKGRWTYLLIPNIEAWVNRKHGEVDYYLTQALSGHGCFRKYLFDRRRAENPACPYCGMVDDAAHTLFECKQWEENRRTFETASGMNFNFTNMMSQLLTSEETWENAYRTIRGILETKEIQDRM